MCSPKVFLTRTLHIGLALAAAVLLHAQGGPPGGSINALHTVENGTARWIYAATDSGVYRSRDDGGTWQAFSDGLPVDQFVVTSIAGVQNQLFAALDGGGIWRWRNEGPWVQTSAGIGDLETLVVATKPGDPQTVLTGTLSQGVFFSGNGGDGWIRPGTLTVAGSFPAVAFAPNDPQRILVAGNPGLVIESRDGGQSWSARLGVPGVLFSGIAFDPSNPDVAYASSNSGIFRQPAAGPEFRVPERNKLAQFYRRGRRSDGLERALCRRPVAGRHRFKGPRGDVYAGNGAAAGGWVFTAHAAGSADAFAGRRLWDGRVRFGRPGCDICAELGRAECGKHPFDRRGPEERRCGLRLDVRRRDVQDGERRRFLERGAEQSVPVQPGQGGDRSGGLEPRLQRVSESVQLRGWVASAQRRRRRDVGVRRGPDKRACAGVGAAPD